MRMQQIACELEDDKEGCAHDCVQRRTVKIDRSAAAEPSTAPHAANDMTSEAKQQPPPHPVPASPVAHIRHRTASVVPALHWLRNQDGSPFIRCEQLTRWLR